MRSKQAGLFMDGGLYNEPKWVPMLLLKNILFTIIVPGTVTVVIPYLLVSRGAGSAPPSWGILQALALAVGGVGLAIYVRCVWDFASFGRGTPAPIDAPKRLVVRGLYRHVRNPMYVGVLLILFGEAAYFGSRGILRWALGFFIFAHLFVVLYEEPTLRRRFGEAYEEYCRSVGRWWPRRGGDGPWR
jgi:protein-S-isoprenylcysteine O-methyltransferase Ste14